MNRTRMLVVTAIAPALWGTTYLATATLLPADRPLTAAAVRALPAGVALLALSPALPHGRWWWRSAVLGAANIGLFFGLLFVSAYRLPGGVASTLSATHPISVAVLAAVVLHEAWSRRRLWGAFLGLGGVALLVLGPDAQLDPWGALAAVGAGASSAAGVVLIKRWGRPVGLLPFTAWQLIWGGVMLAPWALAIEGAPAGLTGANLAGYAWIGLAGTVVAQLLWFRGIQSLPAGEVSILVFLTPLTAVMLGWAVLGERLTWVQLVGAAVIAGSVTLSFRARVGARPASSDSAPGPSGPLTRAISGGTAATADEHGSSRPVAAPRTPASATMGVCRAPARRLEQRP
ncbi:EamA family transporter [Demequina capsici]|uniref:EamA family transporter n=1 Tax=Demequina capsici TaxID=3075620 RepID=A0AA96JBR5_9MICO|nr:EamA family transporter [Demequina sp. PMTSA13]WNM28710.1 EamA family transporter [Demequina sp. PMTSA13]